MDTMQNQSNASPMQETSSRGRAALIAAENLAVTIALTVLVFWRHSFGERYFSLFGIYGKLATYGLLLLLAFKASEQLDTLPLGLFFFVSFALCLWHSFKIWLRNHRGERWHTRYNGTPWLASILPINPFTIKRWIEPALTILAGVMLASFNQALGGWLIFAGTCLGVTEALTAARFRTLILDAQDKDIESRHLRDALIEQKEAKHTEGFVIPVAGLKPAQREGVFNSLTSLYERARDAINHQGGRCGHCGSWNLADAGYCGNCGKPPAVVAPAPSPPTQPPRWTVSG